MRSVIRYVTECHCGCVQFVCDTNSGFIYGLQQQTPPFWVHRHDALSTQCGHTEKKSDGFKSGDRDVQATGLS